MGRPQMSRSTSQYDQSPKQASIPRRYGPVVATENHTMSLPVTETILDTLTRKTRDSEVAMATGYGLDDRGVGVRVPVGSRIVSSRPALGSNQSPIQWVPGALSPGVKRPGCEVDHSPQTSAEVRKTWIYTSTPHTPSWRSA
jgi:hypothetical protein